MSAHRVIQDTLADLPPGDRFEYRLRRDGHVVFEDMAQAPKRADQAVRFVVFGDCGAGTSQQKLIAY